MYEGSSRVLTLNGIHTFALKDGGNPRNFSEHLCSPGRVLNPFPSEYEAASHSPYPELWFCFCL